MTNIIKYTQVSKNFFLSKNNNLTTQSATAEKSNEITPFKTDKKM